MKLKFELEIDTIEDRAEIEELLEIIAKIKDAMVYVKDINYEETD